MKWPTAAVVGTMVVAGSCGAREPVTTRNPKEATMTFEISSPAFDDGGTIPVRYTADGADVSPPLLVAGVPERAASLALIMDDPDAPMGTWVHWVLWNIPPDVADIPEASVPEGAEEGGNSWGNVEYGGPAPPSGTHRYVFKLYALGTTLDLPAGTDKAGVLGAMQGRVVAEAQLVGTYSRER